jgi:hypothetical protein
MIDACDPDADLSTLRKLIKLNTGENIKLTKDEICQVYKNIQDEKLPLPPLILSKNKTYMTDRKSPLSVRDYETLFNPSSKLVDIKRIARKVKLESVEKKTKGDLIIAIGKRLRHLKVSEPIKISRKRVIRKTSEKRNDLNSVMNNTGNKSNLNSAMNNTGNRNNLNSAMNNTGNRNNLNSMVKNAGNRNNLNSAMNNTERRNNLNPAMNNTERRNNLNSMVKNAGNRNNLNSAMNNTERRNNLNPAMNNTERRNNLNSAMNNIGNRNDRKVNFPNESIFKSQPKPDFLKTRETGNSQTSAVRFGDVFQKSTPSFLKRVRRTDPQPKSNVFNNSGPGPAIPMGPNVPNPLPVKPNGSNVPTPVKPNGSNVPTPVKPNGSNVPTPVKPNGSNVPTPVKPNGSNVPTPVKPNGSNVPTPVKPNGSNAPKPKPFIFGSSNGVSDLKSTLKKKLKTLKKLRSDEMNMFLAKVSKLENLDDIFEEARQKDQQRYTEESELIEKKIRNAKTNKERKIAIAENRRIKQEKAAANIQAKKNVAALKRDERKINLSNRSNAIKNAKRALKTNLDSLKQLSRSERNSYLSRVKTVENVDDVFISASQLDQKRYDQKIQNAENKVSKARTEKERLEAKKEKNRLEREQNEEERKARKKAKQLRNQSVRNKLNNTRVQQKIEKLNTNSAIKTAALEAKTRNKKIQTAKNSLKRNLGSLKKLTTSERMAYLSRVRALENIDDVFAEAQRLDQERYDQQLADLKQKNSQVRDEKERKRIAIESRRVIKEQEMAKIQATKNLKRMRELNRSYKNEERKQNIINKKRNDNSKLPVAPIVPPMADIVKPNKPFNAMGKFQNAGKRVGNLVKGFNLKKKSAEPNTEKKPFNAKNKFKGAIGKIGAMKAFKPNTVTKNKFNAKNKFKGAIGKIGAMKAFKPNTVAKDESKKPFNAKNKFKGAVGKIGAMKAFKPNTVAKNKFNAKNKFKGAVGKIGAMKAFKPNVVTKKKFKPNLNTINEKKPFNAKSKFKGAVSAVTAFKPENTFDAAAELDKQLNIKGKELNKANTNKKIRDGVEFKLKQINGLTNTDVTEFMTKWNKSKNKVIFNQARKRGAGRLNGKAKTEERAKPKEENNFNTAAEMNKLNLAPTKNRLLKKAKNEVGRFAGRIGKWDPAIKNAKSNVTLTDLEKQLDKKIELRKEIQMSKLGPIKKRGHLEKVMELRNDVGQRRRIFEEQLKNLTLNTKKKELTKYIIGLNLPAENKSRYVKQTNKPGANLNLIRRSANKQVEEKISNTSKSLVAGAIKKVKNDEAATKIQAAFRGKKNRNKVARMKFEKKTNVTNTFIPTGFDESKVFDNPLAVKPTRTFKDVVKNNKKRRVMNNVKTAAKIAAEKKKLSEATGAERVRLSREQSAATSRNKGKNATAAAGLLKKRNNQFATKGISKAAALKAEQKRAEAAAKKQAKKNKVQEALKAQKARGEALKAKRATKEREEKQKKAVREAAERSAAALKKAASKMEEKEKKRKAGPARNAKLAKELGISKKAAKKRRPKPK